MQDVFQLAIANKLNLVIYLDNPRRNPYVDRVINLGYLGLGSVAKIGEKKG
jgi:hypothetical protein